MFDFHFPGWPAGRLPVPARNIARVVLVALAVLLWAGCSKDELKQALDEAKAKTQSLTDSAASAIEEQLPETGSVVLEMTPPLEKIKAAQLELISVGDGRPNAVQIVTYDPTAEGKTFPALLLHGATPVTSAASLAGATVACDAYLQLTSTSPIAMTTPGASVAVTFGPFDAENNTLTANFGAVQLIGSDDKPVSIGGGQLVVVLRGEEN